MAAADFIDSVQRIFIAFYGRPADPAGLTFWTNQANQRGINGVINAFANSDEALTLYGNQATTLFVNRIYLQLFGRDADGAGLKYWTDRIEGLSRTESQVTRAEAALFILNGAQDGDVRQGGTLDLTGINKKVAIAKLFTSALNTPAEMNAYRGEDAARFARDYIASINADTILAEQNIDPVIAELQGQLGTNGTARFSLTSGIDSFFGTRQADQYVADNRGTQVVSQAGDSISGGALGEDSYQILGRIGAVPATISGIETIILQETQGSNAVLDLTNLRDSGAASTSLRNIVLNDIRTGVSVELPSASVINDVMVRDVLLQNSIARTLQITYNNSQQLTAQLTLQDVNLGNSLIRLDGDFDTVSLISNGVSNVLANGLSLVSSKAAIDRLVITGPAAVDLGRLQGAAGGQGVQISTIDASLLGSSLTVELSGSANVIGSSSADNITDSSGNDALQGNGGDDIFVITTGLDSVEGGAGFDTLILSDNQRANFTDANGFFANIFGIEGLFTDVTVSENITLGAATSSKGVSRIGLSDQVSALTLTSTFANVFDVTTGDGADSVSFDLLTTKGGRINTAVDPDSSSATPFDDDFDLVSVNEGAENVIRSELSLTGVGNGSAFRSGSATELSVTYIQQNSSKQSVGPIFSTDDEGVTVVVEGSRGVMFEVVDTANLSRSLGRFDLIDLGRKSDDILGPNRTGFTDSQLVAGGEGNDLIFGGLGQDLLIGGVGVDTLEGGAGIDIYSFTAGDSASVTLTSTASSISGTADLIVGSSADKVQIRGANYSPLTSASVQSGAALNLSLATSGFDVIVYIGQNNDYFLAYEVTQGTSGTFGNTEVIRLSGVVDTNDRFSVSADGLVSFTSIA